MSSFPPASLRPDRRDPPPPWPWSLLWTLRALVVIPAILRIVSESVQLESSRVARLRSICSAGMALFLMVLSISAADHCPGIELDSIPFTQTTATLLDAGGPLHQVALDFSGVRFKKLVPSKPGKPTPSLPSEPEEPVPSSPSEPEGPVPSPTVMMARKLVNSAPAHPILVNGHKFAALCDRTSAHSVTPETSAEGRR
eukprot:Lithocolla_globosa_v1_NODE_1095_length_2875_cov_9.641135.p3 type:complete len:198 gc:universal NODE_1095_length_2875_cov_9.641135:2248-2841(+)